MSTGFDPYHAWLGSSPGSRPSNHYELLGLKLFQSEPPIIAEAADERMARVEAQLQGPYAAAAKQVLQELTMARAELLSPATKRVYDAQLRAQLGMPPAAEVRPPATPTVRPAAPTMVMPAQAQPPSAIPPVPAAVPMQAVPMQAVPMAAVPMQAVPMQAVPMQAVPMQAVPFAAGPPAAMPMAAMPYGAPMVAQAVPMMAPGVAQAMPVQGYAPGMVAPQPAMPGFGYGESTADGGLEDIETRRRRRRRSYSGPIIAVVALLVVIGGLVGVGVVYRETLIEALENKPQTVIVQGNKPGPEESGSKPVAPAVQPAKAPPPVAKTEMASNVSVAPKVTPPPVAPKKKPPVKPATKPRPLPAGMAVSIKPLSPEEKATVGKTLVGARAALADRDSPKAEEQLNLAMLEASSAESLAAIERMRTLQEAV
ncbi:MAG TPA: hypothetical protein VHY20_00650, partial [Pirellulales bacterium]|nr:hypothetical protein [Pirellulales bacterium]